MEGLGLLYSDKQVSEAISKSKTVLRKYRQLKIAKRLKMPSVKSPEFSDMPRGASGVGNAALDNYLDIVSQMDHIERCVARCELLESILLQRKYLDDKQYSFIELVRLSGYEKSRYNIYLRNAYLQFATAYHII